MKINKENISTGNFEVENVTTHTGDFYRVKQPQGVSICNVTTRNWMIAQANAYFIAEAFNEFTESGMTPKELNRAYNIAEKGRVKYTESWQTALDELHEAKRKIEQLQQQRDELEKLIKHHTHHIIDENGNKWQVLELSDVELALNTQQEEKKDE